MIFSGLDTTRRGVSRRGGAGQDVAWLGGGEARHGKTAPDRAWLGGARLGSTRQDNARFMFFSGLGDTGHDKTQFDRPPLDNTERNTAQQRKDYDFPRQHWGMAGPSSARQGMARRGGVGQDFAQQDKARFYDFAVRLSSMNLRGVNRVGGELRTNGIARFYHFAVLFSVVEHTPRNNGMAGYRATRLDTAGRLHASQGKVYDFPRLD
jgi:hypothetical protein